MTTGAYPRATVPAEESLAWSDLRVAFRTQDYLVHAFTVSRLLWRVLVFELSSCFPLVPLSISRYIVSISSIIHRAIVRSRISGAGPI